MNKNYLFAILIALSAAGSAQLVLNNGIIVNMNGGTLASPITLVLNNSPATPIARLGTTTSQGIMLESEYNRLQYNLDQGTTAITVPYISNVTGSWVPFPFSMYGITAGTRAAGRTGGIRFSSKKAATLATGWDNSAYMPSQVSNVCNPSLGACPGSNNSTNVIDRFWIIEPINYNSAATRPACTFDFTYIMQESDVNGGNMAALYNSLQPQRFDTINTTSPIWGWNGFPSNAAEMGTNTPGAMSATGVGTMTNVQVTAANFFPDWTLANKDVLLPVDLVNFSAGCENYNTVLTWTTAREENAAYYYVEKSADAINFKPLSQIAAVGNSAVAVTYSYHDMEVTEGSAYYRLTEVDKNGAHKTFDKLAVSSCAGSENETGDIYSYHNEVYVNLFSLSAQQIKVSGFDVTGRLVYEGQLSASPGFNHIKVLPYVAQGIYLFEVGTNKISLTKKILIED